MSPNGPAPRVQRGAALLIALLAVALAAMLAGALVERSQRDVARTAAVVNAERAWQYAEGAEGLARAWMRRQREGGPVDPAPGEWTQAFPVPGGSLRARMLDRSGRFNLNALASRDPARAQWARVALDRLATILSLEPGLAERIAGLYVAPGSSPLELGHLSELNRVPGFSASVRERIEPLVTVLPEPDAPIDLNRAPAEVLAATIDGLSPEAARTLRARGPFETLAQALAQPEMAAVDPTAVRAAFDVRSRWYLVHAQVVLDGRVHDFFRLVGDSGSRYDARYVSRGTP